METMKFIKNSISQEIAQHEVLQKNLVMKILKSKRLLSEHAQTVEMSINGVKSKNRETSNGLTLRNTSSVLGSSYVLFVNLKHNFRYIIPSVVGVMPIMYIQKLVNVHKNQKTESGFTSLLTALDAYETAMVKNRRFLRESENIKSIGDLRLRYDKEDELPQLLIQSMKNVIHDLYGLVRLLESYEILEELVAVYEMFEDLRGCQLLEMDLSGELSTDLVRDFFNIFAYVQSQTLLRFALITLTNVDTSKHIIKTQFADTITTIKTETKRISKFFTIIDSCTEAQENIKKQIDMEISETLPKDLKEVRNGAIEFSAKILATAIQCQHLEELVVKFAENFEHPENKKTEEIVAMMKRIENQIAVTLDEHKRIEIQFQRYLKVAPTEPKTPEKPQEESANAEPKVNAVAEEAPLPVDEFYFVDGTEKEKDEEQHKSPQSVEEVNMKLAKRYFKPVLEQLKERIVPIEAEMKERERKILKQKGIEISEELEVVRQPTFADDDDSGSDDDREKKRKLRRNEEKYKENREFLESKQPVNIFADRPRLPFPSPSKILDEEVLE